MDATHVGHMNISFAHFRKWEFYSLIEIAFKFPVAMLGINENKMLDMYYHDGPYGVFRRINTGEAVNNKTLSFTLPLTNAHGNVSLGTLQLTKVYIKAQSVCEFQTFCELNMTSSCKLFELVIPFFSMKLTNFILLFSDVMLIVTGTAAILAIFSTLIYYHKALISAIW